MHLFINVDQQFRENVVTILKNVAPTTLKKKIGSKCCFFQQIFFSKNVGHPLKMLNGLLELILSWAMMDFVVSFLSNIR
jgi:hypothetical protein